MTEILTESFCERCGTRYTFESAAPGQRRFAGLKVLGRGLKQFVLSDDATLDEAIAAARSDAERDATNHQLDAFHRTFSFCMSCRQYTCANCWNETEARCLSCAPLAIAEPEPVVDLEIGADRLLRFVGQHEEAAAEPIADDGHVHRNGGPTLIGGEAGEGHQPPIRETVFGRDALDSEPADLASEPTGESMDGPPDVGSPATAVDHLATGQTPGQSLDDAIAEYEARLGTRPAAADSTSPAAESRAEPLDASAPNNAIEMAEVDVAEVEIAEVEIAEAAAPEVSESPAVAAETAEVTAVADSIESGAGVAIEPDETVEPTPPTAETTPAAVDSIPQPVWPAAPKVPTTPPQWPTGPRWPTSMPAKPTPQQEPAQFDALAALMAHTSTDAMWAASSREILQPAAAAPAVAAVQACSNCGISLSATARFCRRCGTPQG